MNASQSAEGFVSREDTAHYEADEPVKYAVADGIATVTMSRPDVNNVQNSRMTYALDAAFRQAVNDDAVKVIVLMVPAPTMVRSMNVPSGSIREIMLAPLASVT